MSIAHWLVLEGHFSRAEAAFARSIIKERAARARAVLARFSSLSRIAFSSGSIVLSSSSSDTKYLSFFLSSFLSSFHSFFLSLFLPFFLSSFLFSLFFLYLFLSFFCSIYLFFLSFFFLFSFFLSFSFSLSLFFSFSASLSIFCTARPTTYAQHCTLYEYIYCIILTS